MLIHLNSLLILVIVSFFFAPMAVTGRQAINRCARRSLGGIFVTAGWAGDDVVLDAAAPRCRLSLRGIFVTAPAAGDEVRRRGR